MGFVEGSDYEVAASGCWLWQRSVKDGYPRTKDGRSAHRVSYEASVGPVPRTLIVRHVCGESLCINPEHLEMARQSGRKPGALSRFTADDVALIRTRSAGGEPDAAIAAEYGVHRTTIGRLVRGDRWSDADGPAPSDERFCRECGVRLVGRRRDATFCSEAHNDAFHQRQRRGTKRQGQYPVVDGVWMDPATNPLRYSYKEYRMTGSSLDIAAAQDASAPWRENGLTADPGRVPELREDAHDLALNVRPALDPLVVDDGPVSEPARGLEDAEDAPSNSRTRKRKLISAEQRRAIEYRAMDLTVEYFACRGWTVADVSATESYDLLVSRGDGATKRVEVKGTTGDGEVVVLTRNEVANALAAFPNVALAVARGIELTGTPAEPVARGGCLFVHDPWHLDESRLEALAFEYAVPEPTEGARGLRERVPGS